VTGRKPTSPTSSAPSSSRVSAASPARSRISPPTCAAFPRRNSGAGWSIAILPPALPRAAQRAADGSAEPLNVRYWGVGNESWGCGGNFTPEDYATEYRRYSAWIPRYGGRLQLVGSGPNVGDLNWTRGFFNKAGGSLNNMWGWALHHYSWNASAGRSTDWMAGKRDALRFDAEQYYAILHEANLMESLITSHWGVMGEVDRRHRVKLVVDEWGA
jgi:alpha-N-arabinofuranosidase